jgi:signal transduction histidine kinase
VSFNHGCSSEVAAERDPLASTAPAGDFQVSAAAAVALSAAVLDTLPEAVLVTRRDGEIRAMNRHWARFVDLGSVTNAFELFERMSARLGVADESHVEFARSLDGGRESCMPRSFMVSIDGGERIFEVSSVPVVGSDDLVLSIFADVTDRRATAAEQLHAQKLQVVGQLASGLAHEINTPMQFIGDNLEFLATAMTTLLSPGGAPVEAVEDAYLRAEVPIAIAQAQSGVVRVTELVRAMKTFGHPGDGAAQQLVDLDELVRTAMVVVGNETKHVAEVTMRLGVETPVRCFPGDLGQVLVNLAVNAAHAVADHHGALGTRGVIEVSSWIAAEAAVVEIVDDGGGVPMHVRDRIFEPFFTTKEIGRGTGQGLAIARSIVVDRHGGALTFDGNDRGGTTFRIEIPVGGRQDPPW